MRQLQRVLSVFTLLAAFGCGNGGGNGSGSGFQFPLPSPTNTASVTPTATPVPTPTVTPTPTPTPGGFFDDLWVGRQLGAMGTGYDGRLRIVDADTVQPVTPAPLLSMTPDRFAAYAARRELVLIASMDGLNVLDVETGEHVGGSPFHAGVGLGPVGTALFPSSIGIRGFRAHDVAYDQRNNRIYPATTFGLYVFNGQTLQLVTGSPLPAHVGDPECTAVACDESRNRIYLLTSEDSRVTGDTQLIAVLDAATLAPVAGSPFGVGSFFRATGQFALDSARGLLYSKDLSEITIFDVNNFTFASQVRQGGSTGGNLRPSGALYVQAQDRLYIVDTQQRQLEVYEGGTLLPVPGSPVNFPATPFGVEVDPQRNRIYVSTAGGVEVLDSGLARIPGSPFELGDPFTPAIVLPRARTSP